MITLKQFDDIRKEVQRVELTCKAPGYVITLGVTLPLMRDLQSVIDRVERKDSIEYYFYGMPVRVIDGDGSMWMIYVVKGDIR